MIFHDGYTYTLERSTDIKLIFRCQKRDCKGRCHTNLATDLFLTPPTVHSHAPNPDHLPGKPPLIILLRPPFIVEQPNSSKMIKRHVPPEQQHKVPNAAVSQSAMNKGMSTIKGFSIAA
ncbi:unnamed protein product [Didymodactylos carnosus]|uniref:FLYWCH-type domain-containing protein n=1 Tax=Didymodactylos carnosus TaxID=1234261 RepID=A0A8S2F9I2_9BILA|nr:unnamed protein product [Didymodactylos carnosus]CAF4197036.1 unnamed protein product [Didymodactylos carnosus]